MGRSPLGRRTVGTVKDVKYVLLVVTVLALLVWASADVPHTFVAGDVISAAEMNANFEVVAAAISALEAAVGTAGPVTSAVGQNLTIATNDPTWVTFGFATISTGNMYSPAEPTRVTVPADGIYLVTARVSWSNDQTGRRSATIFQNEFSIMADHRTASGPSSNLVTGLRQLSAGDYLELNVFQNSGNDVSVNSAVLDVTFLRAVP